MLSIFTKDNKLASKAYDLGIEHIYIPALDYINLLEQENNRKFLKAITIAMPNVMHESAKKLIDKKVLNGNNNTLYCDNIGSINDAFRRNIKFEVGFHIPVVNSYTISNFADLGASVLWLSPELTLTQIKELIKSFKENFSYSDNHISFGITVMGFLELMTTRHCNFMSLNKCNQVCKNCITRKNTMYLEDRLGYKFRIQTDTDGTSHVYNSIMLDVCHAIYDLKQAGVSHFMIDATLMDYEHSIKCIKRAKKAIELAEKGFKIEKQNNTTTGHLFRGVE